MVCWAGIPIKRALNGQVTDANYTCTKQVMYPLIFSLQKASCSSLPAWKTALPSTE